MKFRIAVWSGVGFAIALCWMLYFDLSGPGTYLQPAVRSLARYSCPIVLLGDHYNFGVAYYWVFLANAVSYGLAGMIMELLIASCHRSAKSAAH